jgi:Zn-finger nucleic acid-binding protein
VVAPARASTDGDATPRVCPRCTDQNLVAQLIGDVLIDECPQCKGMFVDTCALERLLSERRQARADAILGRPGVSLEDPLPTPDGPVYVKCPDCEKLMNRRAFATGATVVDVCRPHGTWFDAHELPRVVQFAMDGGLERAAKRDVERQKHELQRAKSAIRIPPGPGSISGSSMHVGGRHDDHERASVLGGVLGFLGEVIFIVTR